MGRTPARHRPAAAHERSDAEGEDLMPKRPRRNIYRGDLAKPIEPHSLFDFMAILDGAPARTSVEYDRKFGLLLDYHKIPRDDPQAKSFLLAALIQTHVPGMRIQKVRRKPKKWT